MDLNDRYKKTATKCGSFVLMMAEKEGFEPSMGVKAHTPLAGERLRPLGHLSVSWRTYYCLPKISQTLFKKPFPFEVFLSILML